MSDVAEKPATTPGKLSELAANPTSSFAKEVAEKSGQDISKCYQCLRCVAGCPMADFNDRGPADILRLIMMGAKEEVLGSEEIWACTSCDTCASRCPMEISMSRVNDELRRRAIAEGFVKPDNNIAKFHNIFMNVAKSRGRLNEPMLMAHYKWQTRDFMSDMGLGVKMILKQKMNPFVKKHRDSARIRRLFEGKK